MGAVDARGIPRGANPLPRIRSRTPVDVSGTPLKPIRNQQVGGSSPPVGSNDSRHLRACLGAGSRLVCGAELPAFFAGTRHAP